MSFGKVIGLVGRRKVGKTSLIKEKYCSNLKGREVHAYCRIKDDFSDVPNVTTYTNFAEFIRVVSRKKNIVIIIDEAFTCLPEKLTPKMNDQNNLHNLLADVLVNASKMNNFVFIIYHNFQQIPTQWLIPYLNYLIAFATNDQFNYQLNRFRSFPEICEYLEGEPIEENFVKQTIKIN